MCLQYRHPSFEPFLLLPLYRWTVWLERRILARLSRDRQTLFFSATMAPPIVQLAADMVRDPIKVSVTPEATTAETVSHGVFFVEKANKRARLLTLIP